MSRALRLGEVLGRVIHYLHEDFRALLTVIRVNHTWFGWGVVFLWRAPPWRALARVTGDRRQLYANCIYRLSLEDDDHFLLPQFEGLAFPHLQYLSIKTRIDSQSLLILLQNSSRIQHLLLLCRGQVIISDQVWTLLALKEHLRDLELATGIDSSPLGGVSSLGHVTFAALETVAVKIRSPDVSRFLALIDSAPLRAMELEVAFSGLDHLPGHVTLTAVSRFVHLEVLDISFSETPAGIRDELKAFHYLENLRSLTLGPDQCLHLEKSIFTDDDIDQLLSHLPSLKCFELHFQSDQVTAHIWLIISTRCRRLERCGIFVDFTPEWQQYEPLFPCLTFLNIHGIRLRLEVGEEENALDFEIARKVKCIQYHGPRLQEFYAESYDGFSSSVVNRWNEELNAGREKKGNQ